jgi:exodeoxyribonuclease VII large subunit
MTNSRGDNPSFDPARARPPKRGPGLGRDVTADLLGDARTPLPVTRLIAAIKDAIAHAFPQAVLAVGEISNLKMHASGHAYFCLKDASASISAVMFRSEVQRLRFRPADGMEVVVEGRVDLYDVRGQLQLYVQSMAPQGAGALELAFRQLKEKLQLEGLFDPARKKPLARYPRAIGIVTSPSGAAVRDIRRTLARRWPASTVYLVPALVQGEGAAEQIAQAVRSLDAEAPRLHIDTIIVARGGGSLEDLWPFNEEVVARAISASGTPVISGVGHETDFTIADMVADVRAATPTAAAEIAVPDQAAVRRSLVECALRLERQAARRLLDARAALHAVGRSSAFSDPAARLRTQVQRLDELWHRLRSGLRGELAGGRRRLEPAAEALAALHPARLAERARANLAAALGRLRWVLGGRSKRSGDDLAETDARLRAGDPRHRLALSRQKIDAAERQLEAMSYRSVLRRGFSVTRGEDGAILRAVADVRAGQGIETELADGTFRSRTEGGTDEHGPGSRPARFRGADPLPSPPAPRRPKKPRGDQDPTLFGSPDEVLL